MYLDIVSLWSGSRSFRPERRASGTHGSGTNSQGVNNPRYVAQECEQAVDKEVCLAPALKEDASRREDDGKDDLAYITGKKVRSACPVLKFCFCFPFPVPEGLRECKYKSRCVKLACHGSRAGLARLHTIRMMGVVHVLTLQ